MNHNDFRTKQNHIPIAREGIPYILMAMFVTLVAAILGHAFLTWPFLIATLLVGHFFRDPERILTADASHLVSPADGKVIAIEPVDSLRFVEGGRVKISIFMSVFNVHVNRIPYSGVVKGLHYQKGRFLNAGLSRASRENEQNWVWIRAQSGQDVVISQVAGLIARRIVCWPRPGDEVVRGERFGLIRFGSRLDVYVPSDAEVLVSKGDKVFAGESSLCRLI